jgi:hypothetical protein
MTLLQQARRAVTHQGWAAARRRAGTLLRRAASRRRLLAAVAGCLMLVACGPAAAPEQVVREPASASQAGDVHASASPDDHAPGPSGSRDVAFGGGLAAREITDAVELRITLERLLGQHATLATRLMRARVDGAEAFARVAVDALVTNTEELTDVVESVYGPDGATVFAELWADHGTALFNYTVGLVEDDQAAMEDAEAELERYIEDFSAFLEAATDGELAAADLAPGLRMHVDHLIGQIHAFADGDYARAFELQREAYEHMFPTGRGLAGGIAAQHPGELPLPVDEEAPQLRSTLGLLLGEHLELAIDAMRAGVHGAPQFEHAAAALNANTEELTEAMEALFAADDAARFNTLWADHIDAFVQYTAALAEDDEAGREAAIARLHDFHDALGRHLSDMTGGELDADVAAEVLRVHDEQIAAQIDAYAAEDYEEAYRISFEAYQHIFDAAAALATAIEAHVGPELPVGGAPTGGGGTSR